MRIIKAFLIVFLSMMMLSSCSDEKTEKKLDGVWHGECVVEDDDGDVMTLKMTMKLDRQSHDFSLKTSISYPIVGQVAVMRFMGSWKADEEDIMIDIDENSVSVKFDDGIAILAQMVGVNGRLLEKQISEELKNEISGFGFISIKSLTSSEMVLDMFDSTAIFEKENNTPYVTEEGVEEVAKSTNEVFEPSLGTVSYEGTVAGQSVKMELDYSDGSVTGRYCYTKYGEWIRLGGSYDGENLTMEETTIDGNITGNFDLKVDHYATPVALHGSMTNSRNKTYPVKLYEMK